MTFPAKKLRKINLQIYEKLLSFCVVSFRFFFLILVSVETISFFYLPTDIHQSEIENPVETDIEMAEIDDETDILKP